MEVFHRADATDNALLAVDFPGKAAGDPVNRGILFIQALYLVRKFLQRLPDRLLPGRQHLPVFAAYSILDAGSAGIKA